MVEIDLLQNSVSACYCLSMRSVVDIADAEQHRIRLLTELLREACEADTNDADMSDIKKHDVDNSH